MKNKKLPVPGAAILKGITRCESLCNPAVIEKRLFSIYVRQLPAGQGKGWVVRIIDKESIGAKDEPHRRPKGGARKLSLNPVMQRNEESKWREEILGTLYVAASSSSLVYE